MSTERIWIFRYKSVVIEVAVGADDVVIRADSPMEWCIGEKWEPVLRLFEVLGSVSPRDPG